MRNYFCGWYFKCQSEHQTLAIIPAIHKDKNGSACSIQLITDFASWNIPFPYSAFHKAKSHIEIAGNRFGEQGICLNMFSPGLTVTGELFFGKLSPIQYDIMGPFRYIPFMECRHSVFSMKHAVTGELVINGIPYSFRIGMGYWEGDRGRSFPKEYAWTQCVFPNGSLMLSAADIPVGGCHFTGIIGVILWNGKEYRLATYLGAKVMRIRDGEIIIQQGGRYLRIKQLEKSAHPLRAPQIGAMERTIHEHASCKVFYHFQENGHTLFAIEAPNASFEYEYPY